MSDDWHIKFLAVLECLDREAVRLKTETAALFELAQTRSIVASPSLLDRDKPDLGDQLPVDLA